MEEGPHRLPSGSFRAEDWVRFGKPREVSRVEDGFVWSGDRVVKGRVTALETFRSGRAEFVLGSAWTSRFVRDHEAVEPGRFRLGDRGDVLSR